jgi:hypothetical protein
MQQAEILSYRIDLRLACAPQPQRPVRSAVTAHIRPLRSNAFRRDVLSHNAFFTKLWRIAQRTRSNSYDSLGVGY